MDEGRQINDAQAVFEFVTAGNARITLRSKLSGTRFSYRVSACEDKPGLFFVSLLVAPDNENGYQPIAHIKENSFRKNSKAQISEGAPAFMAFEFFWRWLLEKKAIHTNLEVWHEGRCGRCGRTLTVPESIERGIGPECAGKIGTETNVVPMKKRRSA